MPKVTFRPIGKSGEVTEGTNLLQAAEQFGYELRHDCGGFANCSTCRVVIESGMENLSEVEFDEENMLDVAVLVSPYRLACQAKVHGNVVVKIPNEETIQDVREKSDR
jgi:2Fe-2S ferredoxin